MLLDLTAIDRLMFKSEIVNTSVYKWKKKINHTFRSRRSELHLSSKKQPVEQNLLFSNLFSIEKKG